MKYWLSVFFLWFFLPAAGAVTPAPDQIGVGMMIGSITSATGKYWLTGKSALDFGLGVDNPGVVLYGDYLWHVPGMFGRNSQFGRETSGYFGGGLGLSFWDDDYECGRWHCERRTTKKGTGVFIRGLFGFEWYPKPAPWGVFLELGPTILLTPVSGSGLDVGLGGRYYF